jgi:hypothetical protein
VLLEGAGLFSGGVCLVGVSGCGQGIAKHGEGPGLGGMGAQLLPEAGRLAEVLDGLVVAPLAGAEPAQLIEHLGAKTGPLDLRRPQVAGGGQQRLGFLQPSLVAAELAQLEQELGLPRQSSNSRAIARLSLSRPAAAPGRPVSLASRANCQVTIARSRRAPSCSTSPRASWRAAAASWYLARSW